MGELPVTTPGAAEGNETRGGRREDEPVLPSVSRDETDEGWGDEAGHRDEDWYRRERPPHHE